MRTVYTNRYSLRWATLTGIPRDGLDENSTLTGIPRGGLDENWLH